MNHQMDNKMLFQKNYISWLYHVKPMDRSRVKVKGLFRKNICEIFGVYHFLNITNQNFFFRFALRAPYYHKFRKWVCPGLNNFFPTLTFSVHELLRFGAYLSHLISDTRLHLVEMLGATGLTQSLLAMVTCRDQILFAAAWAFGDEGRLFVLPLWKSVKQLGDRAIDVERANSIEGYSEKLSALGTSTPAAVIVSQMLQAAQAKGMLTWEHTLSCISSINDIGIVAVKCSAVFYALLTIVNEIILIICC
jgi:hypothetical protein